MGIHTQQELQMPQNTKDSKGGKNHPVKDTGTKDAKKSDKGGSADQKAGSPAGSQNKGEKKRLLDLKVFEEYRMDAAR